MAPRRSGRTIARQQPTEANSIGLPALPMDILGEIVSQLPEPLAVPPRTIAGLRTFGRQERPPRDSECFQKIDTLRALSVTCRSLRAFALPLAWSRIDVSGSKFSNHPRDTKANKDLATQLAKQLTMATMKRSGFAHYIKTVYLELLREAASETGLLRLAAALESFPNLHTIWLKENSHRRDFSAIAFQGRIFPKVKKLVLSERLLRLLQCCPSITYFDLTHRHFCHSSPDVDEPSNYVLEHCADTVEEFVPFQTLYVKEAKRFVNGFPNIKVLNLYEKQMFRHLMPKTDVHHLGGLRNLQCIRFFALGPYEDPQGDEEIDPDEIFDINSPREVSIVYHKAIEVLQALPKPPDNGHRCVIVTVQGSTTVTHEVISGECLNKEHCGFYRETPVLLSDAW